MLSRKDFLERSDLKFPQNCPLEALKRISLDDYRNEKALVSAALHRIIEVEEDISVRVLGHSSKTAVVKHLFNDGLFRELFQKENRLSWDLPAAKGLSCISFGRVGEPGLLLYDTPAGMVTLEKELTHMRSYRNYESRDSYDVYPEYTEYIENSDYIFDKEYPPSLLAGLLNAEALSCLFVVDAAADVTDAELQEELQSSVATLRERFKEKIVFVKTFEARASLTWDAEKRARREKLLDTILGTDAISFNAETAGGLFNVAFALLKAHGEQGKLAEHMQAEMKCQRLYAAAREISDVILPAFFSSEAFTRHAYSEAYTGNVPDEVLGLLPGFFSRMGRFLIHRLYTETAYPELENRLENRISAFTDALADSEGENTYYYDDIKNMGFWQRLAEESAGVWSTLTHIPGQRYGRRIGLSARSLAKVFYFTYTLIYEIEKEKEPLQGARAMVTETEGIEWFTGQFELSFKDEELWRRLFPAYAFYTRPEIHTALEYFLRIHHPEWFPVFTPYPPGLEERISAFTGGIGVDDSDFV